jgi:hypothetical protein
MEGGHTSPTQPVLILPHVSSPRPCAGSTPARGAERIEMRKSVRPRRQAQPGPFCGVTAQRDAKDKPRGFAAGESSGENRSLSGQARWVRGGHARRERRPGLQRARRRTPSIRGTLSAGERLVPGDRKRVHVLGQPGDHFSRVHVGVSNSRCENRIGNERRVAAGFSITDYRE